MSANLPQNYTLGEPSERTMPDNEFNSTPFTKTYPVVVGLLYVFNLIVGTGALTLPYTFQKAGWLLGSVTLTIIGVISFVTATFIVETLATLNAIISYEKFQWNLRNVGDSDTESTLITEHDRNVEYLAVENESDSEQEPLYPIKIRDSEERDFSSFFTVENRIELGEMSRKLFPPLGQTAVLAAMILYLFGDLSIYAAAVSESFVDAVCNVSNLKGIDPHTVVEKIGVPCQKNGYIPESVSKDLIYRSILGIHFFVIGSLAFFNLRKTQNLQIFTMCTRITAFAFMITLSSMKIFSNFEDGKNESPHTVAWNVSQLPLMFASGVYSFMCHHSIPSLISPIEKTKNLFRKLCIVFFFILILYCCLSVTGVFAFSNVQSLYTWNFAPRKSDTSSAYYTHFALLLFPAFTICASFPIIAITLRNNLTDALCRRFVYLQRKMTWTKRAVTLITISIPTAVAFISSNLDALVFFTGAYTGMAIQYVFPIFLVYKVRKIKPLALARVENRFASPFQSQIWLWLIIAWTVVCFVFITYHAGNVFL